MREVHMGCTEKLHPWWFSRLYRWIKGEGGKGRCCFRDVSGWKGRRLLPSRAGTPLHAVAAAKLSFPRPGKIILVETKPGKLRKKHELE